MTFARNCDCTIYSEVWTGIKVNACELSCKATTSYESFYEHLNGRVMRRRQKSIVLNATIKRPKKCGHHLFFASMFYLDHFWIVIFFLSDTRNKNTSSPFIIWNLIYSINISVLFCLKFLYFRIFITIDTIN